MHPETGRLSISMMYPPYEWLFHSCLYLCPTDWQRLCQLITKRKKAGRLRFCAMDVRALTNNARGYERLALRTEKAIERFSLNGF
jgi:hypothetical protein